MGRDPTLLIQFLRISCRFHCHANASSWNVTSTIQVQLRVYCNKFIWYYIYIYVWLRMYTAIGYILSKASRLMYANVLLPLSLQSLCYRRHFSKRVELSFIPQATCCCQYAASGCPTRVHYNLEFTACLSLQVTESGLKVCMIIRRIYIISSHSICFQWYPNVKNSYIWFHWLILSELYSWFMLFYAYLFECNCCARAILTNFPLLPAFHWWKTN